jgi:hypothetical protein
MKNKRLLNGPGDLVIEQLLSGMVAQLGGSCERKQEGLRLSFPDVPGTEFVHYSPANQQDWTTRLKWVEKQAAIFLLNAPLFYGVNWSGVGKKKSGSEGLRLSVGLSLSVGRPVPKRYTCFLKRGKNEVRVAQGGSLSLGSGQEATLAVLPTWAEDDLPKLASGVLAACIQYRASPEVQSAIVKLGDKRRTELADLERLYKTKQGANDHLYGLPAFETEGSASIEAEARMLQNTVLSRYEVAVRVRVLTLGVFEGNVPQEIYRDGEPVRHAKNTEEQNLSLGRYTESI